LLALVRRKLDEASAGDRIAICAKPEALQGVKLPRAQQADGAAQAEPRGLEAQGRKCAECGQPIELAYSILDRGNAVDGYTAENTWLVRANRDYKAQAAKGYL
jgi:hypothetical protein